MPQEWFYSQGDQRVGPVSARELKRAAADGTLQPTDLVWAEGMADWEEARAVKALAGLWDGPAEVPPVAATPAPVRRPASARKAASPQTGYTSTARPGLVTLTQQWWLIGLALVCCFPAGLVLVWLHPRMTGSTKWIITGVVGMFWVGMIGMSQKKQKEIADGYAAAERQWVAGDKKAAADGYRKLLDEGHNFLSDEQKPVVYGRLIDYDAQSGNAGSAAKLAEQALKRGVEPSADTPAGQAVLAEARRKNPPPPRAVKRTKKSRYTLQELRDTFPIPGTTSKDVYDTLGKPDRHDSSGPHLVYGYEKIVSGSYVMFTFENGRLVDIGTVN